MYKDLFCCSSVAALSLSLQTCLRIFACDASTTNNQGQAFVKLALVKLKPRLLAGKHQQRL